MQSKKVLGTTKHAHKFCYSTRYNCYKIFKFNLQNNSIINILRNGNLYKKLTILIFIIKIANFE